MDAIPPLGPNDEPYGPNHGMARNLQAACSYYGFNQQTVDALLQKGLRSVACARYADPRSDQGYAVFQDFQAAMTTQIECCILYSILVRINDRPNNDEWLQAGPVPPDVANLFNPHQAQWVEQWPKVLKLKNIEQFVSIRSNDATTDATL